MNPGELAVVDPDCENAGTVVYSGTKTLESVNVMVPVPAGWLHWGCVVVVLSGPFNLAHGCLYVLVVGASDKTKVGWVVESRLKRLT